MSDFYRGFPLTQNEADLYLAYGTLPEGFRDRVKSWLEFGSCANCDNRRCMHMVLRDWWSEDIDKCDGFCCTDCDEHAKRISTRAVADGASEVFGRVS